MSQRSHSPIVAVILSLIPGLGHAYVQRPRRGLFIALPWLALIAAAFLAVVLDRHDLEFAVAGSSAFLTVIDRLIIHAHHGDLALGLVLWGVQVILLPETQYEY